jgi:hypothetical protein
LDNELYSSSLKIEALNFLHASFSSQGTNTVSPSSTFEQRNEGAWKKKGIPIVKNE